MDGKATDTDAPQGWSMVTMRYALDVPFSSYPQRYYLHFNGKRWSWSFEVDGEGQYGSYGSDGEGWSTAREAADDAERDLRRRMEE